MESDCQVVDYSAIYEAQLTRKITPFTVIFNKEGRTDPIGVLGLSGPEMTFKGCADSSAKIFFDAVLEHARTAWRAEFEEARRQLECELSKKIEELAAMKAQRDEARREICEREKTIRCEYGYEPTDEGAIAAERGWDCFKEGVES